MSLKQGAGRLIRSETDRGLLVVCDPRMARMPYGARLRAALPPMKVVDEESDALAWLAELARSSLSAQPLRQPAAACRERLPELPPRALGLLHAFGAEARGREVLLQHALGVVAQLLQPEALVARAP